MSYIDIVLLVPIVFGAYKGFRKGLVVEVFSLVGLLLGIIAAVYFPQYAEQLIVSTFQIDTGIVPILSFVVTFLVVMILVNLLGKVIEKMVDILALSFFNKLAGSGFGIVKSLLVLSVVLFLFEGVNRRFEFIGEEKKQQSLLYNPLVKFSSGFLPVFTDADWIEEFMKQKEKVDRSLDVV